MIRVLHIIDSGGVYGAEVVTLNLIEAQAKQGCTPMLLSIGNTGSTQKDIEVEAQSRRIDCFELRLGKAGILRGREKILCHAKALDIDIIHSHGYKGNILLGLSLRRSRSIPIITTLHGWTSTKAFTKIWLYKILDIIAIKNFDRVISVSSHLAQNPLLKVLGIRSFIINNGIPKLDFKKNSPGINYFKIASGFDHKFNILSVGRLSPEKGFDVLIRSLNKPELRCLDVGLVIAGEGPEKARLLDLAKEQDVLDRVHFLGYLRNGFHLMPFFDVFVLPSYREGFPITILEAMQARVPIIATRVGDIPEMLGHGKHGKLVTPGDVDSLARTLNELLLQKEYVVTMTSSSRMRALREYGMEKMARLYLEQYRSLLGQPTRNSELQ